MNSSSRPKPSGRTGTDPPGPSNRTKPTTISSRDPAFEQGLIDSGVYPEGYEYSDDGDAPVPNNIEQIRQRLGERRPSLSPSRFTSGDFQTFKMENRKARTESVVGSDVFPIIRGRPAVQSGQNEKFNRVVSLASGISDAQPDYYNGSRPADLDASVRRDLGSYIIPCKDTSRPVLPNHFTELKGRKGDVAGMELQLTHDLGVGARGMLKTLSYGQDGNIYDGNAYTFGSTYHSGAGTLRMYTMHPTEPAQPGGNPQYHMTSIRNFAMDDSAGTFREGATWFRNSMDLAKEFRERAIAQANEVANARYAEASRPSLETTESQQAVTAYSDSETSMDELPLDADISRKRLFNPDSSRPRKRATASLSTRESTASECWKFADGAYYHFRGSTEVASQSSFPRGVWVYNEDGWPNGNGKQWCFWRSGGDAEYR